MSSYLLTWNPKYLSEEKFDEYFVGLEGIKSVKEVMNSDHEKYGGSGLLNSSLSLISDQSGFMVKIPPLSTTIFKVDFA